MSSANDDRTVGALPASGPDERKARFFREVASAFEFLALYHSLPAEAQRELMTTVQSYSSQTQRQKG